MNAATAADEARPAELGHTARAAGLSDQTTGSTKADACVATMPRVVIDTNVVLDLFLFQDPRTAELAAAIAQGKLVWLRTPRMREECRRVLAYAHLQGISQLKGVSAEQVLDQFDALTTEVEAAAPAPMRCRDGDDQCFIDLAVAHGALLVSKDKHVLKLRKRLRKVGIAVTPAWVDMLDSLAS